MAAASRCTNPKNGLVRPFHAAVRRSSAARDADVLGRRGGPALDQPESVLAEEPHALGARDRRQPTSAVVLVQGAPELLVHHEKLVDAGAPLHCTHFLLICYFTRCSNCNRRNSNSLRQTVFQHIFIRINIQ